MDEMLLNPSAPFAVAPVCRPTVACYYAPNCISKLKLVIFTLDAINSKGTWKLGH